MNRRTLLQSSAAAAVFPGLARRANAVPLETPGGAATTVDPGFRVQFVRHAESQINELRTIDVPGRLLPPDSGVSYPLTADGVGQAVALGEQMRGEPLLAIVSSTRLRATQTADAVSFAQAMTIELGPALAEVAVTDPGASMSTVNYLAVVAAMTAWVTGNPDAKPPGGESLTEVLDRFLPFVQETIAIYGGHPGTLLFVSHSVVLGAALPYLFDNVSAPWAMTNVLPNCGIVSGGFVDGVLRCSDWAGQTPQ